MYIKTKPWTFRGWSQLATYIAKERGTEDDYGLEIFHNVWSSDELADIVAQFKENDAYRPERSKQTGVVHEILSFSGEDRERLTPEIIQALTHEWLDRRAPNALAYGCVHQERSHLHVHLMLSANEFQSARSTRLELKEFIGLRKDLEMYSREFFPEETRNSLAYTSGIDIPEHEKLTPGRVTEILKEALDRSLRIDDLNQTLARHGLEVYEYRGRPAGVRQGNRKFRWKRLGLEQAPALEYTEPEQERGADDAFVSDRAAERESGPVAGHEPHTRQRDTNPSERFDWTGERDMWEQELIRRHQNLPGHELARIVHEALRSYTDSHDEIYPRQCIPKERIGEINKTLGQYGLHVYGYKGRAYGVRIGDRKIRWNDLGFERSPFTAPPAEITLEVETLNQVADEASEKVHPEPTVDVIVEQPTVEPASEEQPTEEDWRRPIEMGGESAGDFAEGVFNFGLNMLSRAQMVTGILAQTSRITSRVIGKGIDGISKAFTPEQQPREPQRDERPNTAPSPPSRNSPEEERALLNNLLRAKKPRTRDRDRGLDEDDW